LLEEPIFLLLIAYIFRKMVWQFVHCTFLTLCPQMGPVILDAQTACHTLSCKRTN
jgi:hypothetical protein